MLYFYRKHKITFIVSTVSILALVTVLFILVLSGKQPSENEYASISEDSAVWDILEHSNPYASAGALSDYEIGEIVILDFPDEDIFEDSASENGISDEELAEEENETLDEYLDLAIANVDTYVNVRSGPSTDDSIVGRIYDGAVAQVQDTVTKEDGEWFQIISGNVDGYIKAEYFISGNDAAAVAPDYVTNYATVTCSRLNVRNEATTDSSRLGYAEYDERLTVIENLGDWLKVSYSDDKEGYVSAEYVRLSEEFTYARTIDEDNALIAAAQQQLERETVEANETTAENLEFVDVSTTPQPTYSTNSDLRNAIVANAMQYLGNRYVMGGQTLAGGTDCSGFTSLLLAQYGYALSRTPQGQYAYNGRSVSYEEAQPGDIVCYSGNGYSCTHVAIYIGNGQIIHSSTPRRGVITASITSCGRIMAIKNVID